MKEEIKNLIKAIEENTMSGMIENNRFMAVVPIQYINSELEYLKDILKNERRIKKDGKKRL